jgi:hypothetical protein
VSTGEAAAGLAGHSVMLGTGHVNTGKVFLVCDYLAFSFSLFSLMCALAAMEIDGRRRGWYWRITYFTAIFFLVFASLCTHAAFTAAAFMNFERLQGPVIVCCAVGGCLLALGALWVVLGRLCPFYEIAAKWCPESEKNVFLNGLSAQAENWKWTLNDNYSRCGACLLEILSSAEKCSFCGTKTTGTKEQSFPASERRMVNGQQV